MRDGYWVIRTYNAGNVGEKTKYFVPGKKPDKKVRRKDRREASRQEKNASCAKKNLARLLNENFSKPDNLLIGLDYNPEGLARILAWGRENGLQVDSEDEEERLSAIDDAADHELNIGLRRVKRILQKEGVELKAAYITSHTDPETKETVRVHHHLVVNGESLPAFLEAWGKYGLGNVSYRHLWENQKDRTPIAEYFMDQVTNRPDAKKYKSTRNLIRPKPHDQIAKSDAELRVPKSCELVFRQEFRKGGDQYIRYLLPPDKEHKPKIKKQQEE